MINLDTLTPQSHSCKMRKLQREPSEYTVKCKEECTELQMLLLFLKGKKKNLITSDKIMYKYAHMQICAHQLLSPFAYMHICLYPYLSGYVYTYIPS